MATRSDQVTSRYILPSAVCPPAAQVTTTGQFPGVVCPPTCHVQETAPVSSAVTFPNPAVVRVVVRYCTSIAQTAPGTVCTFAIAVAPAFHR